MLENIIDWQAQRGPERPAIWFNDNALSYGDFARHIALMTAALERENLPPGVVLIATPSPALHWLLTLALERLGFATVCELAKVAETARLVQATVVVTTIPNLQIDGVRVFHATQDWRTRALAGTPSARRSRGAPEDIVRIVLSSGTTGDRKQVAISRGVMDSRLCRPQMFNQLQASRGFSTMGSETIGGFQRPLASWLSGGSAVMTNEITGAIFQSSNRPTEMVASPTQLRHCLPLMIGAYSEIEPLNIRVGGSATPPTLIRDVAAQPGLGLFISYGSTESGTVAWGPASLSLQRPGAVGYLTPWTQVEIVDENGTPRPLGASGVIRVRGPDVVQGYVGDPTGSEAFRDGWFYPNDIGHLDPDGVLIIDGRRDDVINIGGVKLSSARVEETLLSCRGVEDAAVAVFPMESGSWALYAAIVSQDDYETDDLRKAVMKAHMVQVRVVKVEQIPRNRMGKIMREAVKRAIMEKTTRK